MLSDTMVVHPSINLVQHFGLTVRGRALNSQTPSAISESSARVTGACGGYR